MWSLAVLLALGPRSAFAGPVGPEFRINTTVADSQVTATTASPRAVAQYSGGFVVVWQSRLQDGSGFGIFAQRFNSAGGAQGSELPVNTTTVGSQTQPVIAMDNFGRFVVAWQGEGLGDADGIFARRYNASGTALGLEWRVNETTAGLQSDPDVALDADGDFVIAWHGNGPGDADGIFARAYGSSGSARTGEFIVNTDTAGAQAWPSVHSTSNGEFVIAWEGETTAGDYDIYFQRFSGSANPFGVQTRANTTTRESQRHPCVSRKSNGDFVLVWQSDDDTTVATDWNIYLQRFSGSGTPQGPETRVNTNGLEAQIDPFVDMINSADFVVTWTSDDDPTTQTDWNVWTQLVSKSGNPIGANQPVNTTSTGPQGAASTAVEDLDHFVVAWSGNGVGDDVGVFSRLWSDTPGPSADIALAMSVSDSTPTEGSTVTYTITLTNNGPDDATGLQIRDALPAGVTYVSQFATLGNYSSATEIWDVGTVSAASSEVLQITVAVDTGTAGLTIRNVASVAFVDQADPSSGNNVASADILPGQNIVILSAQPQIAGPFLPGATADVVFELTLTSVTAVPETLRSVTFTNAASGPGSQAQLDAAWSPLTLEVAGDPTALATRSFANGTVSFDGLSVALPPFGNADLIVRGAASLTARDGDVLDLRVAAPTHVVVSGGAQPQAAWPLDPAGSFTVDGMVAAQIQIHDVSGGNFFLSTARNVALDVTLPANGYEADVLQKLNIVNLGSAVFGADIEALEAWVDTGNGGFDASEDRRLGTLVQTGNRWELTALSEAVPPDGLRLFVTVDITATAVIGRTIRLGIGSDTDVALGMASGNDGPIDRDVFNRFEQSISTKDRVTLTAGGISDGSVAPGSRDVPVLHLVATNNYAITRTLSEVSLSNTTISANSGTQAEVDAQFERLSLRLDGDDDGVLDDPGIDPVVARSFFAQGRATLEGFNWVLPPGAARHLFITADVSLDAAADGDALGVELRDALDVGFAEPTAVLASWPLDSGARWTIDGMVAAQITNLGAPGVTLGPDDAALALDLVLPANGYAADVLQGVTLRDLGTNFGPDLADMRLWQEGGDGVFNPRTGDDVELGPMVPIGGSWKSPQLAVPVNGSGLRLFVEITVSGEPAVSSQVRLSVPVAGISMASGNDGPIDAPVVNPETLVLSSAPLLATLTIPATSAVGQSFEAKMLVQNRSSETVTSIAPTPLVALGDAVATQISGPTPAQFDLPPAGSSTFTWTYTADATGTLQLSASAEGIGIGSGLSRRSLETASNAQQILFAADSLLVESVGGAPFSINRGETDVVPLNLTLTNPSQPGAASVTSDVLLRELRLRVENDQGADMVPASIFSRLALSEGSTTYVETTALPTSGSEVTLVLATPIAITANDPVTISVRCDILPTTVEPVFRVAILDRSWLVTEDANNGTAVPVRMSPEPIRSGAGQVHAAPSQLDVRGGTSADRRVGRGQTEVELLSLDVDNNGIDGLTSSVRIGGLELVVTDENGVPQSDPARFFRGIRVKDGASVFGEDTFASGGGDTTLVVPLSLPPVIPVNSTTQLIIVGDVTDTSPVGRYRLRLADPSSFDARDENTNEAVTVVYASSPVEGPNVDIEANADSLAVRGTPAFPQSFTVGEVGRTALVADLRHPGTTGVGRVRVRGLSIQTRDETRRELPADLYIDRLRLLTGSAEVAVVTQLPMSGSFDVPIAGLLFEPGEISSLTVEVDIEATAPASFLEVLVSAVDAVDENLGSPVLVVPEPGAEIPLTSGLTRLAPPATELVVGMQSQIPAALVGDGSEVPLARLELWNNAVSGSGRIDVDRLVLAASDRDYADLAVGAAATRILVYVDDQVWADSGPIDTDAVSVELQPPQSLSLTSASTRALDVVAVLRRSGVPNGLRLRVDADGVGVVQPSSALLTIRVESAEGQEFPFWTEPGSFTSASLHGSFANFPNPFAAGRETTTFVYFMPSQGHVDLRILTPRGELVATLLQGEPRAAGLQQVDTWQGQNGRGNTVYNGVYLAELVVRLDDGTRKRLLRRVAVVR